MLTFNNNEAVSRHLNIRVSLRNFTRLTDNDHSSAYKYYIQNTFVFKYTILREVFNRPILN